MVTTQDISGLQMPWESIEAIVNGISAVDLSGMSIADREEAYEFVLSYGYDMHHPEDAAEIHLFFVEAVNFIETHFLGEKKSWLQDDALTIKANSIPKRIRDVSDALDLVVLASQEKAPDRYWACAILKVMHVLAHIKNGLYYKQIDVAREQILKNFYDILDEQPDGSFVLRGKSGHSLKLYGFEAKPEKTLESTLVKLLCKKEVVSKDLHDLIGVRFITHTPAEAILAVRILREQKAILFPNIIPTRSRNTLIDLDAFRGNYDTLIEFIHAGDKDFKDLESFFSDFSAEPPQEQSEQGFDHNVASSPDYRSIHITCRQLIRTLIPDTLEEIRYFMPYEIQITDQENYFNSRHGSSAHQIYKKRQFSNAGKRVLGPLLSERKPKS